MTKEKKSKCCKNFEDSACPCLDKETGERSCQTKNKPENKGCGGDCGCATPKPSEP